jgi:hypothetical protein
MLLRDRTAGIHLRRQRISMARKGVSIARLEVGAAAGANATPEFPRFWPLAKLPVLQHDTALARQNFAQLVAAPGREVGRSPDQVAAACWSRHSQPRYAWNFEPDLRPTRERW